MTHTDMATRAQLFDTPAKAWADRRWGVWLPVPYGERCPCGGIVLRLLTAIQLALFVHGGYGAAERSEFATCTACHTSRLIRTYPVNPRKVT